MTDHGTFALDTIWTQLLDLMERTSALGRSDSSGVKPDVEGGEFPFVHVLCESVDFDAVGSKTADRSDFALLSRASFAFVASDTSRAAINLLIGEILKEISGFAGFNSWRATARPQSVRYGNPLELGGGVWSGVLVVHFDFDITARAPDLLE